MPCPPPRSRYTDMHVPPPIAPVTPRPYLHLLRPRGNCSHSRGQRPPTHRLLPRPPRQPAASRLAAHRRTSARSCLANDPHGRSRLYPAAAHWPRHRRLGRTRLDLLDQLTPLRRCLRRPPRLATPAPRPPPATSVGPEPRPRAHARGRLRHCHQPTGRSAQRTRHPSLAAQHRLSRAISLSWSAVVPQPSL